MNLDLMDKVTRSFRMQGSVIDKDKRTAELSFSSDEPVRMGQYDQVLMHDEKSVDLSRLNDNAPLLLNHDTQQQIGVVEKAWIDGNKGRALVRFSRSNLGEEIFNDVVDGIRQLVSVGYTVNKYHVERSDDEGLETQIVSSWTPLEISSVPIPADGQVGFGRAIHPTPNETENQDTKMNNTKSEDTAATNTVEVDASRSVNDPVKIEIITEAVERKFEEKLAKQNEAHKREMDELQAQLKQSEPVTDSRAKDYADAGFSLSRAVAHKVQYGVWGGVEKEISDELRQKSSGYQSDDSLIIPNKRTVTTSTAGSPYGGYMQDTQVQEPVDALRAQTFFDRVGATVLSGLSSSVKIPRLATSSTVAVNTEGGTLSGNADPVFGQESLDPHIVQGQTDVSKSLLATNVVGSDNFISRDLNFKLGDKMEALAIEGSGSSGQPQGLKTLSGATTSVASGTNGTAYSYSQLVKMTQDSSAANARLDSSRFLTSSAGFGKARRTEISSGTAMFAGSIDSGQSTIAGFDAVISNNVPSADTKGSGTNLTHFYFGDFSYMVLGLFGATEIQIDPYTQASKNLVRINATVMFDIAYTQPAAFSRLLDAITS